MATTFKNIRDYIRAALQDYDPSNFLFADQALNQQIRFQILSPDEAYTESEVEKLSEELTSLQKLNFSIHIAVRILSGQADSFLYASPVLSVRRIGQVQKQIQNLQEMLDDANGGRFAISVDDDFTAVVAGFTRYQTSVDAATSNV